MRWMVLILGLFLSGCYARYGASYQGPPPLLATSMAQVDAMVGAQQPAAYKVGFMEGCDSGRLSAGNNSYLFKKDTNRFDTDDAYQQGWNDGFNRCVSGEGAAADNYYYPGYYGYYYPDTFYSGFYYPGYYYAPGYSLWLGYYGYPHYSSYVNRHNYYYTPWYGGRKHRGGGYNRHGGNHYVGKHRGGGRSGGGHGGRGHGGGRSGGGHGGGGHGGGGH